MTTPYWTDGKRTIYHGDCREILPTLGKFDAVVADPPWNCGFFGKNDDAPWPVYADWLGKTVRSSEEIAEGQVWFLSTKAIQHVSHLFDGYKPFAAVKNFSQMNPKSLPNCWDIAFIKSTKYTGKGRNWFLCDTAGMMQERTCHPTPRSLDVMRYVIGLHGWKTILDPFMGSGTTLLAAKLEGLEAVGIELSEKYCEAAVKRLQQNTLDFIGQ